MAKLAVLAFLAGKRVLYAVPTADQVVRFWSEVIRSLAEPIEYGVYRCKNSEHLIENPGTDARIRAKTAWNADSLRGDFADLLILDEWQLMDELAWEEVGAPMLIDNNGDAVFIYTPPSIKKRAQSKARDIRHASKMYQEALAEMAREEKGELIACVHDGAQREKGTCTEHPQGVPFESRWLAVHFSSLENPFISEEGLAEIAKDMSRLAYKQEILAQDVREVPGALWKIDMLEDLRVRPDQMPPLERITTGVDPTGSQTNEAGIVSCGRGGPPSGWTHPRLNLLMNEKIRKLKHYYVIKDSSFLPQTPRAWAAKAVSDFDELKGDLIVGERNYGGDMVSDTIRTVRESISYKDVTATRGKLVRAQPIASLYEQGIVHHVGNFDNLEDEQTSYIEGDDSPNRMDALVWAMTELMSGQEVLGLVEYFKLMAQGGIDDNGAMIQKPQDGESPTNGTEAVVIVKTEAAKTLAKPVISAEAPRCPSCQGALIQTIAGGQKRCQACGHQFWLPGTQPNLSGGMSRGDYLAK